MLPLNHSQAGSSASSSRAYIFLLRLLLLFLLSSLIHYQQLFLFTVYGYLHQAFSVSFLLSPLFARRLPPRSTLTRLFVLSGQVLSAINLAALLPLQTLYIPALHACRPSRIALASLPPHTPHTNRFAHLLSRNVIAGLC